MFTLMHVFHCLDSYNSQENHKMIFYFSILLIQSNILPKKSFGCHVTVSCHASVDASFYFHKIFLGDNYSMSYWEKNLTNFGWTPTNSDKLQLNSAWTPAELWTPWDKILVSDYPLEIFITLKAFLQGFTYNKILNPIKYSIKCHASITLSCQL